MRELSPDLSFYRSQAVGKIPAERSPGPNPRCPACRSRLHRLPEHSKLRGRRCAACGLMVRERECGLAEMESLLRHYRSVDPHASVAASKSNFFDQALHYLDSKVVRHPRRLLDVGCGFGYFLEKAEACRWETLGVEIVPEAIIAARGRVPTADVFPGDLVVAKLPAASLDAVTLWDVLCHVEDPAAEIEECHRLLASGGIIGIRIRNLTSQLWLCRWFFRLHRLWRKLGVKPLHVFHHYNFTPKAIEQLLVRLGFINISIQNSPLTTGDPYQYVAFNAAVELGKFLADVLSGLAYRLTHARWIIGPSLLVWAQKP